MVEDADRTMILAASPAAAVCALAEQVLARHADDAVHWIQAPRLALVQLRVAESVAETAFNAGDVLVAEARVDLAGAFGFGMVLGDDLAHAAALAVLDAASRLPGGLDAALTAAIATLGATLRAAQQRRFAISAATRVQFETF